MRWRIWLVRARVWRKRGLGGGTFRDQTSFEIDLVMGRKTQSTRGSGLKREWRDIWLGNGEGNWNGRFEVDVAVDGGDCGRY